MSMFRKPGDSSSSEDETSSTREEISVGAEDNPLSRINTLESSPSAPFSLPTGGTPPLTRPGAPRTNTDNNIRDLLLHSLLEDKAVTEAAEHLGKSKTDPDVLALAQQTYQGLARQFSSQIDDSYALDSMRQQRVAATEGINRATRMQMTGIAAATTASGTAAAAGVSQALVTRPFLVFPSESSSMLPQEIETLNDLYHQLPSAVQGHTAMHNNRYAREYEEVEMVGKGGFGKVFKVKHKLDNAYYAVKRIVISANKLQKIRERGDVELHSILEEVRSLAQFDHNNITRYHGAWMEFAADAANIPESSAARVVRPDRLLEHASETSFSERSANPLYDSFDSLGIDDPFEHRTLESAGYIHFEDSDSGTGAEKPIEHPPMKYKGKGKARRGSQATIATISSTKSRLSVVQDADEEEEDEIEMIPRQHEPTYEESESVVTDSDAPHQLISTRTSGPVLTLNIQMSLYESNLAAFLSNEQEEPSHCFHPCISLELLGKVIKGVEYLHASGVVHRDLKPANVFLSFSTKPVPPAGSVDLSSCVACPTREKLYCTPRIGDFGLVAVLGACQLADSKPAGTHLYRPTVVDKIDKNLDVYALGIVGFEILESFGTKMERVETLTRLRRGEIGEGFAKGCGNMTETVKRMVLGMVAENCAERWTLEKVRREIVAIIGHLRVG